MTSKQLFAQILEAKVLAVTSVGGGDISDAYYVSTTTGEYFLKVDHGEHPVDFYDVEAKNLMLLNQHGAPVPADTRSGKYGNASFLSMEFLSNRSFTENAMKELGVALAQLHENTNEAFGLGFNNYIGKLPQTNTLHLDWVIFYIENRLQPLLKIARDLQLLSKEELPSHAQMQKTLQDLMPNCKPALLHGDLWSGNVINTEKGVYFIDPAVYFGHSEVDIAMTKLFGGFSEEFYAAYHESYPLESSHKERTALYQLYYLLVHLVLFGPSYRGSVLSILRRFW